MSGARPAAPTPATGKRWWCPACHVGIPAEALQQRQRPGRWELYGECPGCFALVRIGKLRTWVIG